MAASGEVVQIDLSTLPIKQLNQLNQQLEQEMEFMTNSLKQLKSAQSKFSISQSTLKSLSTDKKEVMIPLTNTLYVPGKLSEENRVILDVGTGYYVEKTSKDANDYFDRKMDFLKTQMEKIQPMLQEKFKMRQAVSEILQSKIKAQVQLMQQQQEKT